MKNMKTLARWQLNYHDVNCDFICHLFELEHFSQMIIGSSKAANCRNHKEKSNFTVIQYHIHTHMLTYHVKIITVALTFTDWKPAAT